MNYKPLIAIFVALVILSIGSIVYAVTETTITENEPVEEITAVSETEAPADSETPPVLESLVSSATDTPIIEETPTAETAVLAAESPDYTEYFLAIIDIMNLTCACLIAAIVIIVLTIISMRWI